MEYRIIFKVILYCFEMALDTEVLKGQVTILFQDKPGVSKDLNTGREYCDGESISITRGNPFPDVSLGNKIVLNAWGVYEPTQERASTQYISEHRRRLGVYRVVKREAGSSGGDIENCVGFVTFCPQFSNG